MAGLKTVAACGLLGLGLWIAVAGKWSRGMSLFALGALLAASIAQSVVVPRLSEGLEDPAVVGAVDALAGLLTAFAAGIGGCLAQLWTEAALALAFGFSALVMVLLFLGGFAFTGTWWLELLLVGGFVAIAWLGHTYASKDKPGASVVATALMGTLLAACAVDGLIEGGKSDGRLLADLTALTTGDWESIGRCGADGRSGCHGWVVALGWIAAAFAGIAVQAKFTGTNVFKLRQLVDAFCFRRDGHQYTEVRDGPGAGGKAKSKVAVRKAHSRGDSHALSEGPRAVNVLPLRVSEGGEEEAEGGMKRTPEEVALIRMLALMYDELTNVFGFQNQSAYNQVEHLVLLLGNQKRYSEAAYKRLVQPAGGVAARLAEAELSPADILHQRLFQNYTKWARHHKVEPQFNTHPGAGDARRAMAGAAPLQAWYETPAAKQKLHDCLLWLLIWGEAANLRHMPECVAWLYHKMAGYFKGAVGKEMPQRGDCYFLNNTVAPIYKVVCDGSKGKDHAERRNYDDFNEFFWSRECLQYAWKPQEEEVDPESGLPKVSVVSPDGSGEAEMVADVMKRGPKTFIEKRSWLAIFLTFRRIIDFHVLTFHLMAVFAFWDLLVWEYPYALQLLSSVFLAMNFMGILWCGLEIWQTLQDDANPVPAFRVTPAAKYGFAFRLIARFAFLFQQCRFYGLSLQHDGMDLSPGVNIRDPSKAAQLAYWWQYVWVSLLLLSPWLVGCLFQVAPRASTWLYETQQPHVRVLLDILYPQSRNYTGKRVHERPGKVVQYVAFWAIVLTGKFWFSYLFEVRPLALPALELSDDLVNLPGQNAFKTGLLIVARWAPFVAIYALDTIIWYSVAAGLTGVLVGLQEKLGQVQTFSGVRAHFMRVAESFSSRLVFRHDDPRASCRRKESTLTELKMPRTYTSSRNNLLALEASAAAAEEAQPLVSPAAGAMPRPQLGYRSMSSGGDFMDVATSKWKDFAKIWNAVVDNLRQTDVINNDERDMLKFHMYDKASVPFSKPIYLPVFQTAGSVEKAERICSEKGKQYRDAENEPQKREVEAALWAELREDATMYEAVSETLELGLFLLEHVLGGAHFTDVQTIKQAVETLFEQQHQPGAGAGGDEEMGGGGAWATKSILESLKIEEIESVRKQLGTLVSALKGGLGRRKPNPNRKRHAKPAAQARQQGGMVKVGSAMKKSRSGFLVPSLSNPDLLAEGAAAQGAEGPEFDSLREKVQKAMRELLGGLKKMIEPNAQQPQVSNIRMALNNITEASRTKRGANGEDEGPDVDNYFIHDAFYASQTLDEMAAQAKTVYAPLLAKLHGLVNLHVAEAEPRSAEARRRLTFFVNSLFMDLPKAPSVRDMMSWSVLTPFYGEDVLSSLKELKEGNEDGINTLLYLKTIYKGDWENFIQRLGVSDEAELFCTPAFQRELRVWASLRAQTLTRTVQGMMYYEESLQVLGQLDREAGGQPLEALDEHIRRKFGYVVSCQIYGRQKQEQDAKAEDIEWLLNKHPSLRVAYIDEVRGPAGSESAFYSVLIKGAGSGSTDGKGVTEIYRVKLPGNPVLGEGKPENQNHAVIFTRGEHVMAIDMNQEGYFEDAFKMRNFLQEFAASDPDVPTTILGFREHIFTGGVSSLANYMALQEFSFVTLGQRVLNRPLRMRLHYGHPDVFDKLFFMQNGGVSKASKSINLSEDIFAGYNNVLRGGAVEFKEYVQVGKGRDVGMQPICKFEGKLSEGAAEQSLSRDLGRMLARLDFFRLLSFYFGGIGHYLCSVLTVTAIWGLVYLMLGLALFGLEKIGDRPIVPEGALQFALAGVGVLQTVPLFCTLLLERGFLGACTEVFSVFISGGPLYFIFHIRTRDYYYSQTVLAGGTGYKATGRGFTINHLPFDENFRFFAYSHLHLGFEVVAALVLLAFYSDAGQYAGRTWSLYFAAAAFLFAPFWFNPMTFEWGRVYDDYIRWRKWSSNTGGAVVNSWESWWKDECAYVKKLTFGSKLYLVARSSIWALIGVGLLYGPLVNGADTTTGRDVGRTVLRDAALLLCLFLAKLGVEAYHPRLRTWQDRHMFLTLFYGLMAILAAKLVFSALFSDVSAFVFVLAGYYVLAFVTTVLFVLDKKMLTTHVVKRAHWIHDQLVAHAIFLVLFALSVVQVVNMWQRYVLYSNSLSKGVVLDELIRNARQEGASSQQQLLQAAAQAPAAQAQQQRAAAVEAVPSPAAGGARPAGPSGPGGARIQPEEKPAEQRVAELEAGSGGSSKGKRNGRGSSSAGAGASGAATQQAEAPRPTQVVEAFEFRQPTDFPKRS